MFHAKDAKLFVKDAKTKNNDIEHFAFPHLPTIKKITAGRFAVFICPENFRD